MYVDCDHCHKPKLTQWQEIEAKLDLEKAERDHKDKNMYYCEEQFQKLFHWYFLPNTDNPQLEHSLLKKLAQQWSVIFEVWDICQFNCYQMKMISLSGIEEKGKLQKFINQAVKIIRPIPTYLGFKFQIRKQTRFTRYGSYEISDSFECTICMDKKTLLPKTCCGKFICQACNTKEKCPFCNQSPILIRPITPQEVCSFVVWKNNFFKMAYGAS